MGFGDHRTQMARYNRSFSFEPRESYPVIECMTHRHARQQHYLTKQHTSQHMCACQAQAYMTQLHKEAAHTHTHTASPTTRPRRVLPERCGRPRHAGPSRAVCPSASRLPPAPALTRAWCAAARGDRTCATVAGRNKDSTRAMLP